MAQRSGSADLPLHNGRVPPWLASRMARLGTVITEAIVHHYGREEFLRRLAHPYWFQSFGAVMGMDWHSSGITTAVIGALKRGLDAARQGARPACLRRPRQPFAPDAARAGRDRRAHRLRRRGAGQGEPAGRQGRQRRGAGRLRPLPARLHRHRRRPVGRGAAGHERREQARAPLSLAVAGSQELRRDAAQRDRRQEPGRDRQSHRPARQGLARGPARAAAGLRARPHRAGARRAQGRAGTASRPSRCCRI